MLIFISPHCYFRSDPPKLTEALTAIKEIKDAADSAPDQVAANAAADAAMRHLLLNLDVDLLYRAALGMYDLPLAFMVVSHAQKDPGEYLNELESFANIKVRVLFGPFARSCHLVASQSL